MQYNKRAVRSNADRPPIISLRQGGNQAMAKSKVERKRTEQIKIWATPDEKALIQKKMALYGTTNMGAFIRKMAIDGYILKLTIPELKEMIRLLGIANNNINQIARSLNTTGRIYETDLEEIRTRIDGLYDYAGKILHSLTKLH